MTESTKQNNRERRKRRVRAKVVGSSGRPRLCVFKSNKYIYAQIINDETGETVASADSRDIEGKSQMEQAKEVGARIAEGAKKKGILKVVFDRSGYLYTGKIKELAEASREAGLNF